MRIECVRVAELERFAQRALGSQRSSEVVPISRHRARAWARNPCAEPDDPALYVAYDDDRCVGFAGVMPGRLETPGGSGRVLWISSLYVAPGLRGHFLGARLLRTPGRLGYDLASNSPSPEGARLVLALGWQEIGRLDHWVADLNRRDLLSAPARALRRLVRRRGAGAPQGLDRLVQACRGLGKRPLYRALLTATAPAWEDCEARPVKRVRDRPRDRPAGRVRFVRDAEVVNWMLQHRWVTTDRAEETVGYHFRDWRPRFDFLPYEIHRREDNGYLGFAVLRIDERYGNRRLAVLDHDLDDPRPLLPLAVREARRLRADRLVLPQETSQGVAALGSLSRLFERRQHTFYYRRSGDDSPTEIDLRLVDGDYTFT